MANNLITLHISLLAGRKSLMYPQKYHPTVAATMKKSSQARARRIRVRTYSRRETRMQATLMVTAWITVNETPLLWLPSGGAARSMIIVRSVLKSVQQVQGKRVIVNGPEHWVLETWGDLARVHMRLHRHSNLGDALGLRSNWVKGSVVTLSPAQFLCFACPSSCVDYTPTTSAGT